MEWITLILFVSIFLLILYGYPVALTLGGLSTLYALFFLSPEDLGSLALRIQGVMSNYVLLAVPLFVFMGAMLAASTGIVGATVVTMGMISLPVMLKRGYSSELARERFSKPHSLRDCCWWPCTSATS